ncbi:hypothetical protein ACJX0J_037171, partial [Zea mays]
PSALFGFGITESAVGPNDDNADAIVVRWMEFQDNKTVNVGLLSIIDILSKSVFYLLGTLALIYIMMLATALSIEVDYHFVREIDHRRMIEIWLTDLLKLYSIILNPCYIYRGLSLLYIALWSLDRQTLEAHTNQSPWNTFDFPILLLLHLPILTLLFLFLSFYCYLVLLITMGVVVFSSTKCLWMFVIITKMSHVKTMVKNLKSNEEVRSQINEQMKDYITTRNATTFNIRNIYIGTRDLYKFEETLVMTKPIPSLIKFVSLAKEKDTEDEAISNLWVEIMKKINYRKITTSIDSLHSFGVKGKELIDDEALERGILIIEKVNKTLDEV